MNDGLIYTFAPGTVAFALIISYPKWYTGKLKNIADTDKVRGDLSLQFLKKAEKHGYRLVIADADSAFAYLQELKKLNGAIIIKRYSLNRSEGKQQAIQKASKINGVKVIITTETEKVSLLDYITAIVRPLIENEADIVVPEREPELFLKTFPRYQYDSELEGNKLYNEILRSKGILQQNEDLDFFFGPRAFLNTSKVVGIFTAKYKKYATDYSSVQFFPLITALTKKMRVVSVQVGFSYPELQKANEQKGQKALFVEKRAEQLSGILSDLNRFLDYPKSELR